jgi:hypothetical protein
MVRRVKCFQNKKYLLFKNGSPGKMIPKNVHDLKMIQIQKMVHGVKMFPNYILCFSSIIYCEASPMRLTKR